MKYKTILIDPPWNQKHMAKWDRRKHGNHKKDLPYPTMSLEEIKALDIISLADTNCHLWTWTTNQFLPYTFEIIRHWGFKYLSTITWVKPSGVGAWFVNRTQHLIFAYKDKLDMKERFLPTVYETSIPKHHSSKPTIFYNVIDKVSYSPKVEIFAREKIFGWDAWGNEVNSDFNFGTDAKINTGITE